MTALVIPEFLDKVCRSEADKEWLSALPANIQALEDEWSLELGDPILENASVSWVAPCRRQDGNAAILKLGMPHIQADDEIKGLAFWRGDPTVLLLESDRARNAMLLERCIPGDSLKAQPLEVQDRVVADILMRLRKRYPPQGMFRTLVEMVETWRSGPSDQPEPEYDFGLKEEGDQLRAQLAADAT